MALLYPKGPLALLGMLAAVLNAGLRVAIVPLLVTPLFDELLQGGFAALPELLARAGLVVLGGALALFVQDALLGLAAARLSARWRAQLYEQLLARPPGTLPASSGALAGRVLSDLKEVESYYQFGLGTLVAESATLAGTLAVLLATNARATLYLLALALPAIGLLKLLGGAIERRAGEAQAGLEALSHHLQEGLKHHAVVRAFAAIPFMLRRFAAANRQTERRMAQRVLLGSLAVPLSQLLIFAAAGVLLYLLSQSVARGENTVGEVASYLTLLALLATPSQLLPRGYALLRQAAAAAERLKALASAPQATAQRTDSGSASGAGLALRALYFSYRADKPLLCGLELELPARGFYAIAGDSGSGKSTLLKLILGFLPPNGGEIYLAGRPLGAYSEAELRAAVAYVPQEAALLSGSLRDNLTLGREVDEAALWQVLEQVALAELVATLPGELDYPLREDGDGLSGGQRQRLAVARALLGAPKLLMLDEPSANLDGESEAALIAALQRSAQQRLVLAVSHQPALLKAAERCYLLAHGKLSPLYDLRPS